jgi:hypothetical protein
MSREKYRYTVYDNKTGFPIAVNMTSEECSKQMGIKFSSWYNCVNRCGNGSNKRWTILKHNRYEQFGLEEYQGIEDLPLMIRITQLAEFLSTTDNCVVNICKRIGVPIIRAGTQKIKMVSRKTFFDAVKGGE